MQHAFKEKSMPLSKNQRQQKELKKTGAETRLINSRMDEKKYKKMKKRVCWVGGELWFEWVLNDDYSLGSAIRR